MPKYHISRRTWEPVVCTAKIKCPYGDMDKDHFASREDAYKAIEKRLETLTFAQGATGKTVITSLPANLKVSEDSLIVPKGLYVLADPKALAGRNPRVWEKWEQASGLHQGDGHAFGASLNGRPVVALKTVNGEGVYQDSYGRSIETESGLIGLTSLSFLKQNGWSYEEIQAAGPVVNFGESSAVTYEYGVLSFGKNVQIFTDVEPGEGMAEDPYDLSDLEASMGDEEDNVTAYWDQRREEADPYAAFSSPPQREESFVESYQRLKAERERLGLD